MNMEHESNSLCMADGWNSEQTSDSATKVEWDNNLADNLEIPLNEEGIELRYFSQTRI